MWIRNYGQPGARPQSETTNSVVSVQQQQQRPAVLSEQSNGMRRYGSYGSSIVGPSPPPPYTSAVTNVIHFCFLVLVGH